MKKYYILILIAVVLSYFSFYEIQDYENYKKAKNAYLNKNYKNALKYYKKINKDKAKFDEAVTEYRLGDFNKTINILNDLNSTKLEFKKLHNLGNSYAKMNRIDEGIKSYEKALLIKDDNDTRYNLELLKNLKEQKEQKEQNKQDKKDNKQTNRSKKNQKNQKDQDKINKNNEEKNKNEQNKDKKKSMNGMNEKQNQSDNNAKEHEKKDQQDSKIDKDKEKKSKNKQDKKKTEENKKTYSEPINIEEKKWQKFLDNREIGTLMMPFDQKEENDEKIKPW